MELTLLVAMAENRVIGNKGRIPWELKEDMRRFRRLTLGHAVIMGRVTYESILQTYGKPLDKRLNVVLTKQPNSPNGENVLTAKSLEEALQKAKEHPEYKNQTEVYILGGQRVYEQFMPLADKIELTKIHKPYEGDAFFPEIKAEEWKETRIEDYGSYSFITLSRVKK